MRKIVSLVDHELTWTQPKAMKSEYELRFGGELVGTLVFPKMFSSIAQATSGDGAWTFERVGFWKAKTVVRPSGSEAELGSYTANPWKGGGTLQMPDHRQFKVTVNLWRNLLEVQSETGETLIQVKNSGVFRLSASVRMYRAGLRIPEFSWIVLLGFYLMVIMRREAAAHAASS